MIKGCLVINSRWFRICCFVEFWIWTLNSLHVSLLRLELMRDERDNINELRNESSTPQWMVGGYVPGTSVDYRTTAADLEHFLFDVTRCGLRSRDLDTEFPAKSRVLPASLSSSSRCRSCHIPVGHSSHTSSPCEARFILRTPNKDVFYFWE